MPQFFSNKRLILLLVGDHFPRGTNHSPSETGRMPPFQNKL